MIYSWDAKAWMVWVGSTLQSFVPNPTLFSGGEGERSDASVAEASESQCAPKPHNTLPTPTHVETMTVRTSDRSSVHSCVRPTVRPLTLPAPSAYTSLVWLPSSTCRKTCCKLPTATGQRFAVSAIPFVDPNRGSLVDHNGTQHAKMDPQPHPQAQESSRSTERGPSTETATPKVHFLWGGDVRGVFGCQGRAWRSSVGSCRTMR